MAHAVIITWTASIDPVDGYNVYRGINPPGNEGSAPINASLIVGTSYTDSSVVGGQKLDYIVTAVKNGVESTHSNEILATVPIAPPTNLVLTSVS